VYSQSDCVSTSWVPSSKWNLSLPHEVYQTVGVCGRLWESLICFEDLTFIFYFLLLNAQKMSNPQGAVTRPSKKRHGAWSALGIFAVKKTRRVIS
jgi:hypothetical protein